MQSYFSGSVIVRLIAVVLLLLALDKHPYGYYKLLRWVVCGANVFAGFISMEQEKKTWVWVFGIIAVLFNPIIPFRLDRDTWHVIDLIVAVILGISTFIIRGKNGVYNRKIGE